MLYRTFIASPTCTCQLAVPHIDLIVCFSVYISYTGKYFRKSLSVKSDKVAFVLNKTKNRSFDWSVELPSSKLIIKEMFVFLYRWKSRRIVIA